jgi:hypothetical protein
MAAMYLVAAAVSFVSGIIRQDVVPVAIGLFLLVMWGVTR